MIPEERGGESREPRKSSTAVLEIKKRASPQISPPNVEPNHPQLKIFPQEDPHSTFVHASHEIPGTLVAAHRPRKYDILQPPNESKEEEEEEEPTFQPSSLSSSLYLL